MQAFDNNRGASFNRHKWRGWETKKCGAKKRRTLFGKQSLVHRNYVLCLGAFLALNNGEFHALSLSKIAKAIA